MEQALQVEAWRERTVRLAQRFQGLAARRRAWLRRQERKPWRCGCDLWHTRGVAVCPYCDEVRMD